MVFSEILGGLGEMTGGIIGLATQGKGGKKELQEAVALYKNLQDPKFDMRSLQAPQLTLLAKYFPETYEAKIPQEVKLAQDSPELRSAQMEGIQQLTQMSKEGLPTLEAAMVEDVQGRLGGEVSRQRQQALRNLQETGRQSSGTELAAGLAAAQQGSNLARQYGTDTMKAALENRMNASSQLAAQAGAARGQDISLSQQQADTMNKFNQWQSQLQTQAASDAAAARNAGTMRNVSEAQRVAEQNATNQYGVQQQNLDRQNQMKQALAQFQLQKAQGTAGALGNLSQAKYAEQAAKMAAAKSIGKGAGSVGGGVMDMFGGGII